jgi:hypothetical protein
MGVIMIQIMVSLALYGSIGLVCETKSMGVIMGSIGHYGDLEWLWFGKDPINGSNWVNKCSSGLLHITTCLKGNLVRSKEGKVSKMVNMHVACYLIHSCIKLYSS